MPSTEKILGDICGDNIEAQAFCDSLYNFLHLLDDLYDKDHDVTAQECGWITIQALETFAANRFFQNHVYTLMPAVRSSIISWVDSEEWHNRDGNDAIAAHVIKSQYHEVLWMVAGIVGGLEHQMEMTRRYRDYDWS